MKKLPPLSNISKIWYLLMPEERRNSIILFFLMLIGVGLETLGVGLVIPALSLFTQKNFAAKYPTLLPLLNFFGNPDQHNLVVGGLLLLLGVYFIKAVYLVFLTWNQNRFTFDIGARLSLRLFTIYLRQPYAFHLQRNSAQLIRNVTNEVSIFTGSVLSPMMQLFSESLIVVGLCLMLLVVEPIGTISIVCVLGLTGWSFFRFTEGSITRWGKARQHHEGLRLQHLQQGLGGAKDVKLLGREGDFLKQYSIHNRESAKVSRLNATMQQLPRLWLELLAVCGLVALVLVMLAQGGALETIIPKLGLFAVVTFRLMPSVNRLLNVLQSLKYCLPVIDVLQKDLILSAPEDPEKKSTQSTFHKSLELQHITYTYPGADLPSLKDISLTIKCGESIGFIGTSGAGKSTLVDILLGLLPPDQGTVKVDDENIQQKLRGWQNQIGYVPQSIYLTDDTLLRNIAFGLSIEEINKESVLNAIRAAHLEDFIQSLPDGLDTVVGERGVRLSGGQRQRIGIARALYHDPSVLVLDEATSALDTATEQGVMEAVRELQGSKTIIIVAHRLSTIEHCDRLYNLENGRIKSVGPPGKILH